MMNIDEFGKFLSERRRALGMTQGDLAEKLNVTPKAVSRWERCVGYPDIGNFRNLAEALEVSLDSLFACRIKDEAQNNEEILQIMQASVEIDRKNNRIQERIVGGLILCVTILTGVLFYFSGHGNLGASLFFGLIASGLVISVYYLLAAEDKGDRRLYAAITAVFSAVLLGIFWVVLK